jgi:chromosomal replication initiation ATPase DnaA
LINWPGGRNTICPFGELLAKVAKRLNIEEEGIECSRRQSKISDARAIICYLGVTEMHLKGIQVAKV